MCHGTTTVSGPALYLLIFWFPVDLQRLRWFFKFDLTLIDRWRTWFFLVNRTTIVQCEWWMPCTCICFWQQGECLDHVIDLVLFGCGLSSQFRVNHPLLLFDNSKLLVMPPDVDETGYSLNRYTKILMWYQTFVLLHNFSFRHMHMCKHEQ